MSDVMRERSPNPGIRKRACLIVVALVLAAIVGAYTLMSNGRGADTVTPSQPRPALAVTTIAPEQATWPDSIAAQGVVSAWQEASIGTQIGSYQLIEVRVNVGDRVRRGQVLARLNPALLQAEEAQLVARHEQAVANDRRAQSLLAVGAVSEQEALHFATEARTAAALLDGKRLELGYTRIVAPDDGVMTARTATLGAVMPAGQELFRMIRQNRLEWRGEVTPEQLGRIAIGQRVVVRLPNGDSVSARIRQIAPALDDRSRLALVYADLEPGGPARAGMYLAGEIMIGESPALVVPASCVVVRDGRSYVAEIVPAEASRIVRFRAVTIGRRRDEAMEVVAGLSGGERLVKRGTGFLNDGDVVRVVDDQRSRR